MIIFRVYTKLYSSTFKYNANKLRLNKYISSQFQSKRAYSLPSSLHMHASQFQGVGLIQDIINYSQASTGLPWWSNILMLTFGLRTFLTLPLVVYQHKIIAKFENVIAKVNGKKDELQNRAAIISKKIGQGDLFEKKIFLHLKKQETKALMIQENCHPLKASIIIWTQLPLWVGFSFALRNNVYMLPSFGPYAEKVFLGLQTGGLLWFQNLTMPDPYFVLPLVYGAVNLANISLMEYRYQDIKQVRLKKILGRIFKVITVVMIPIAATLPSSIQWYWLCSSSFGIAQNMLMMHPKVRRFLNIPKTYAEPQTPFTNIKINIARKLRLQ